MTIDTPWTARVGVGRCRQIAGTAPGDGRPSSSAAQSRRKSQPGRWRVNRYSTLSSTQVPIHTSSSCVHIARTATSSANRGGFLRGSRPFSPSR
jgi:hypothetical protein